MQMPTFAIRVHYLINHGHTKHKAFISWEGNETDDVRGSAWFDHGQALALKRWISYFTTEHDNPKDLSFEIVNITGDAFPKMKSRS